MICPIHNRPLFCPACIGAKGGKSKSVKKLLHVRENLKRADAANSKKNRKGQGT